ncbi:uncharacterized protein LOC120441778 isoform X2 [Oreochromis aureus]|nr:uncharacterized protein LOC120441778 isoform X2 [Oreochromis aureus]
MTCYRIRITRIDSTMCLVIVIFLWILTISRGAPVKVSIQHVGNRITCSSEGIYPEPELTWSTRPPSKVSFKNTTTVEQTKQQLYNINGSLIASLNETDRVYSCTVSTQRNRRRASLRQLPSVTGSFTETTIPCPSFNTSPTSLIWRFLNRAILEKTGSGSNYTVSKEWKQHVKAVSELGSLTLLGLSSEKEGIYTCEISNVEEMLINYTIIQISQGNTYMTIIAITAGVVVLICILSSVCLVLYCRRKRGQQENSMTASESGEPNI